MDDGVDERELVPAQKGVNFDGRQERGHVLIQGEVVQEIIDRLAQGYRDRRLSQPHKKGEQSLSLTDRGVAGDEERGLDVIVPLEEQLAATFGEATKRRSEPARFLGQFIFAPANTPPFHRRG